MIPQSSLLANRKQFLSLQSWGIADSVRPPGLANRRLSCEHCVNTLAVGRMCCVEPTAPQCKVSPPYIPRSRKYIHRMAPLCGGLTPFFSTPAVKQKKNDSYPNKLLFLLYDLHSQVECLSICLPHHFSLD